MTTEHKRKKKKARERKVKRKTTLFRQNYKASVHRLKTTPKIKGDANE